MRIVPPSIQFRWATPDPLQMIESAGRTCYKSEAKITPDSAAAFVKMLLMRGHTAMIEHASMSYKIICDRGTSHMIVRHRLFSFAQESTQYCNYQSGGEIVVVQPAGLSSIAEKLWARQMEDDESLYLWMIANRYKPEIARAVLPTCLKTELVITGNFTEWRHFFKMRCAKNDQLQSRQVACAILRDARERIPVVFDEFNAYADREEANT